MSADSSACSEPDWGWSPPINTLGGDATTGKTEVSFEQWNHEFPCMKDHYPEVVVMGSIIRPLKWAVADMARYMGSNTSIDHILLTLLAIFGTVALFDVLMQNFYKSQGSNKRYPFFATRLEETLNQIQLQCPRRMMDLDTQQHLRDCPFPGMWKYIHDSVWYLYSTPDIWYFQLMKAAWKAECKNEKTQDWVRSRATVKTEQLEEMAKLKQQTAQLMAALTQTMQGNGHTNTLNRPWKCGCGCGHSRGGNKSHLDSHNVRGGPSHMTLACSLLTECMGEGIGARVVSKGNKDPV